MKRFVPATLFLLPAVYPWFMARADTSNPVFSPGVYCGRRMAAICRAFRKSRSSSRRQQRSELRPRPKEEAMSHPLVAVRRGRRNVVRLRLRRSIREKPNI